MTVQELIKQLQREDPNETIRVASPTHDYVGTVLAEEVVRVECVYVEDGRIVEDDVDDEGTLRTRALVIV